jgi:dienelactone hydrolase
MKLIVATDIHGPNSALCALLQNLGTVEMVSPWGNSGVGSMSEPEAVAQFFARGGVTEYAQRIAESAQGQAAMILGFSVGATSAWHYLASAECHSNSLAVLYYGSRIRDALQLVPRCQTHLVFAEHEVSFSPIDLKEQLASEQTEFILATGKHHGFMNPMHPQFDSAYAKQQIAWLSQMRATYA